MIYNIPMARLLLGALCNKPQALNSDKYSLTADDFPLDFHRILFQIISYLAKHGSECINAVDIQALVEKHETQKNILEDNDYIEFINTVKKLSNVDNLQTYYEEIKKCSILRAYKAQGFNIDKFYNGESVVEKYSTTDIVQYYEGLQIEIKKKYYVNKDIDEYKAGNNFLNIKEQFKKEPMFGATTYSELVNTATRGLVKGQLTIYSAASGSGKTTIALYNLVRIACKEIWSDEEHKFINNPCYMNCGVLYLQYELNPQYEINPKIIASISGVPTTSILNGKYLNDEEERVDRAIQILNESKFYIVTMPSFTVGLIETYIKDYVYNKGIEFVCFDYISEQATASSDIAKHNGVQTRSDQVLSTIASKLKDIAVELNVSIFSFTQVNANAYTQEILDAGVIAGSRAVQNKCDVAGIIMPLRKTEQEIARSFLENKTFSNRDMPNRVLSLYKVRFGEVESNIKIWFQLDLSTGRVKDCWATDSNNKPYPLQRTNLVYS